MEEPPPFPTFPPLDPKTHKFIVPEKGINTKEDFEKWKTSNTFKCYSAFVYALNDSVKGKKISDDCHVSPLVEKFIQMLDKMDTLIDETPPTKQPTRYGNQAFRTWYTKIEQESTNLITLVLPEEYKGAAIELGPYLVGSIGNYQRIDYGTGHEAAFCMLLCCFTRLGLFGPSDYQALVTRIFVRYLSLMRKLQRTYLLEPAGSHGVWGLDDYQFLPFVWGAAQLIGHKEIKPKSIHSKEIRESYEGEYMYLACIQFIYTMKSGPFGEHSPYLNDISFVPHQLWEKVNNGMLKIYHVEVLNKFPVIQHFLFGSIFPFE